MVLRKPGSRKDKKVDLYLIHTPKMFFERIRLNVIKQNSKSTRRKDKNSFYNVKVEKVFSVIQNLEDINEKLIN